ncbi:MAG: hypothetical protein BHV76_10340 [Phocaeicola plebeius]|uniref:Uncharacterized protein n=1 Tax=Phocaeicola plebeius TaxID=310297 RepID=A0A854BYP8_9BACT|nr:MAG: hypothetical protein BHV76_10340 [Phocaeicola plebeius]
MIFRKLGNKNKLPGIDSLFYFILVSPPKKVSLLKMKKAKTKVRLLAKIGSADFPGWQAFF